MSAPARRRHDERRERDFLDHLLILYKDLPHENVRWNTAPGQEFLTTLAGAVDVYGRRAVADALDRSVQGVDYMLNRRRLRNPSPYPSRADLIDLLAAWSQVQAIAELGKTVYRYDPAFVPVHEALMALRERYDLSMIALAAKIPIRKLRRFEHPPMPRLDSVARAVREAIPPA